MDKYPFIVPYDYEKSTGKSACTLSLNIHCLTCLYTNKNFMILLERLEFVTGKKMKWHNHMINEFKVQLETDCLLKTELVHRW